MSTRARRPAVNAPYAPGGRAKRQTSLTPACAGSGKAPRCLIDGDWWVGTRAVCDTCGRGGFKPTKRNTVPRHNDYRKTTP